MSAMKTQPQTFQATFEGKAFLGALGGVLLGILVFLYNWRYFGDTDVSIVFFCWALGFVCFYVVWGNRLSIKNGFVVYKGAFEIRRVIDPSKSKFQVRQGGIIESSKFKIQTILVKSKDNSFRKFNIPANLYTKASIDDFLDICRSLGVEFAD
jgi:hypothetical protein